MTTAHSMEIPNHRQFYADGLDRDYICRPMVQSVSEITHSSELRCIRRKLILTGRHSEESEVLLILASSGQNNAP